MMTNNLFSILQQLRSNPMQVLNQRFNVPKNLNNPTEIIQHLLDTRQVSQSQVNQAMMMRNNPMLQQLLGKQ